MVAAGKRLGIHVDRGVVVRQAEIDSVAWPVIGKSKVSGPPLAKPQPPPDWWAEALITD